MTELNSDSYFTNTSAEDEEAPDLSMLFPVRALPSVASVPVSVVGDMRDALTCSICEKTLFNPVFTRCAHRFCRVCIERELRVEMTKKCPICNTKIASRRDLRHDHATQALINVLFDSKSTCSSSAEEVAPLSKKRDKEVRIKIIRAGSKKRRNNSNDGVMSPDPIHINDLNKLEEIMRAKQDVSEAKKPADRSEEFVRTGGNSEECENNEPGKKWNLEYEMRGLTMRELNEVKFNFPSLIDLYGTPYLHKL